MRSINLSPLVQVTLVSLLSWNPVVGTSAKTHALVEVLFPAKVIQPVGKKPFSFISNTGKVPRSLVRSLLL